MLQWIFRILIGMFLVGMVGSLIVVCITTVEDLFVLFEKDEQAPGLQSDKKPEPSSAEQPATL